MIRRVVNILISVCSIAALSNCYRAQYQQAVADRITCVSDRVKLEGDNQTLRTERISLDNQITALTKQVQDLTTTNQALARQVADYNSKIRKFDFYFRKFCCDRTTEGGADEVYIVIVGSKLGAGDVISRAPYDPKSHWDMNDGDQPEDNPSGDSHCLTDRALISGELKPGESYYYNVTVFEQDGGNSESYQKMAASLLAKTGNPFAVGAAAFISALTSVGFFVKDTDDWMGMYGLKVTNKDGVLVTDWQQKRGIIHLKPDPDAPTDSNRKEIRMNHDGSNYVGWFGIRY